MISHWYEEMEKLAHGRLNSTFARSTPESSRKARDHANPFSFGYRIFQNIEAVFRLHLTSGVFYSTSPIRSCVCAGCCIDREGLQPINALAPCGRRPRATFQ